ncbi:TPA: hypothetical protein ACXDAY_002327 [Clostridium botulinum]|uniref:hypothetical protein n=1 Tax=Clostridium botulinum TaxID=1491 RepID=UPI00046651E1|nr:hypothetical protein [Clostridium botulinum]APH21055.1 hypothetical protein NPD1_4325 [Clostridium botulinum]APQ71292.1 hypothetical protein RSJ8_4282 [Clostridium botulinum]APR02344.1 hypothetical protein RSJ2_4143 [Clostridium botulinum]AUN01646.1 hypothetical protein RSJ19_01325 [Clostridium botulinum]MBN3351978.1 hypothetical protein [Clostridium botulinum]
MCMCDDIKEVVAEYKNIYDYKGNKQAWEEYEKKLHKIEEQRKLYDNEYDSEIDIVDFESEEEYWNNEIKEWENILD